jgi:thiamine-monophosphate kinase
VAGAPDRPNEFEIIARYFDRGAGAADVVVGIGDDAAVIDVREPLVVATDTLVAGVHFPDDFAADALGYRALAVNLSDLAAMGARPRWCTLALTVPAADAGWLAEFAGGLFRLADELSVTLIGGDLTRGPLTVTIQILGTVAADRLLTRGGGRPGDDVYVTGTLGDAAAGLPVSRDAEDVLGRRFAYPTPRVAAGLALGGLASAAIDVSDGLVADLGHVCEQSGCAAEIDVERLPLSEALLARFDADAAYAAALAGGDDYELCFAAPPGAAAAVAAAARASATPMTRIGSLVAGTGVRCRLRGRRYLPPATGYRHF